MAIDNHVPRVSWAADELVAAARRHEALRLRHAQLDTAAAEAKLALQVAGDDYDKALLTLHVAVAAEATPGAERKGGG